MRNAKGQALTETILVVPLLAGLVFGLVQFSVFFSARTAFERACAQAARLYAAGKDGFGSAFWDALGTDGRFFDPASLRIESTPVVSRALAPFQGALGALPAPASALLQKAGGALLDYGGTQWIVTLRYTGLPFSAFLFPGGVPVRTQLAVLRSPAGDLP